MHRLIAADLFRIGHYAEAAVGMLVGAILAVFAIKRPGSTRRRCAVACAVFLLFGLSDVVKVRTGAWWRPWWLLFWKGLCVLAFVGLLSGHLRELRKTAQHSITL